MNTEKKMPRMTEAMKQAQIRKEALATSILFLICAVWHVGFGYLLTNINVRILYLPLWWWVSTPGVFVVAIVGVVILLKCVFKNFDLGSDEEEEK